MASPIAKTMPSSPAHRSPSPSTSPTRPMIPRSQPPRAHSGPAIASSSTSQPHRPPRRPSIAKTNSVPISTTTQTSLLPSSSSTAPTSTSEAPTELFPYSTNSSRPPSTTPLTTTTGTPSSHPLRKARSGSSSGSSASANVVYMSNTPATNPAIISLQQSGQGQGMNGMHSSTLLSQATAGSGTITPVTGLGKMAAAAKARAEGVGRRPSDAAGSGRVEEESHPLSEKSLKARDYQTVHTLSRLFHLPTRWKLIRPLGQGAYGLVIQVQDSYTGEHVAVKCITRVFDKVILARRALREITLLRHFGGHENLTGLIDLDNVWDGYNEIYLYMEPMEADLHQIVRSGQPLSNTHIQYFIYQLLRGMKYIHSANVIHRDLKPGNLLVNADCELKICDFGLARGYRPTQNGMEEGGLRLTEYVATRWYRAPEVMLSNSSYTTAMDVWSIGCILAEVLGGKPLFKGSDYVHQINLILAALGTPDEETLVKVGSEKACAYMRTLPHYPPVDFHTILPEADPDAISLLADLLHFDPSTRLTVPQALKHAYVATYHDESDEPSCSAVFDKWEQVESLETIEELKAAITKEIEEYRTEVRTESVDDDDDGDDEGVQGEEEEAEWVYEYTTEGDEVKSHVTTASPGSLNPLSSRQKGMVGSEYGVSPRSNTVPLPTTTNNRERSPGTPLSVFSDDSSNPGTAGPTTGINSGRSSRRTSTHSMHHPNRRPTSFLFSSGLGAGMTPMSSITPMTMSMTTSISNTSSNGEGGAGGVGGGNHSRSGSLSYSSNIGEHNNQSRPGGRRSRAPSSTLPSDFTSLRPLIRQLSTLGMDAGGERDELGRRVDEVPPMSVCDSDAPPSEAPKSFAPPGSQVSRGPSPS